MSVASIAVLVALGLGIAVLVSVIVLAVRSGRLGEQARDAREEADHATELAERLTGPMPSQEDRARAVRRRLRDMGLSDAEIEAALRGAADGGDDRDPPRAA